MQQIYTFSTTDSLSQEKDVLLKQQQQQQLGVRIHFWRTVLETWESLDQHSRGIRSCFKVVWLRIKAREIFIKYTLKRAGLYSLWVNKHGYMTQYKLQAAAT